MKVKQYHPDVNRDGRDSDALIRRVIQAYEVSFIYRKKKLKKFIIDSVYLARSKCFQNNVSKNNF